MSSTREDDEWPHDLIAFKWAETLSEDEQAELLASSLRRLQDRINATLRQREQEVRAERWLPIETAPRTDRKWLVVARFDSDGKRLWWERAAWRTKTQQWHTHGGFCEPTHWLRLSTSIRRDDTPQEGEQ